jgi:hypothetical protein
MLNLTIGRSCCSQQKCEKLFETVSDIKLNNMQRTNCCVSMATVTIRTHHTVPPLIRRVRKVAKSACQLRHIRPSPHVRKLSYYWMEFS